MRRTNRRFRKLFVQELEGRTTPAWVATLASGVVSFTGDAANDSVIFSVSQSKLSHNLSGQFGLASPFDLDPATIGEQSILIAAITDLSITGNGGSDTVTMNDVPAPATIAVELFHWAIPLVASANADVVWTNSAFTVSDVAAPYMYGLSGTTGGSVNAGAFAGSNVFDASAYTGGNIQLFGSTGDDTLKGGSGADVLNGGFGADTLEGNNGNDIINEIHDVAGTINFLRGGGGSDTLNSSDCSDVLEGGDGGDVLNGGGGNDTMIGGPDADSLDGGDGDDTLNAGDGNDALSGGNGVDIFDAGPGNDTINDWLGDGATDGGAGTDQISSIGISDALITNASATLNGLTVLGCETFVLTGTAGNDVIDASTFTLGTLSASGSSGNDTIKGGSGADNLNGGFGADTIEGNLGNDLINDSNDVAGTINFLRGGSGSDTINSSNCSDVLEGGDGNDTLVGGVGNDTLDGGGDNDVLIGDDGNDILIGGDGSDSLNGGNDNDTLRDGPGANSSLNGGAGTDLVELSATPGADIILVATSSVTINGAVSKFSAAEALTVDAGAGIDDGTQIGATHPLPYVVNNLEPTFNAGPDEISTAVPFVRVVTFKDIGSGQTWTAEADFGDGTGFQPMPVDAAKLTVTLNHEYVLGGNFTVTVRVRDNQLNLGTDTFTVTRPVGIDVGVNGGSSRSMVTQVRATFGEIMTINPGFFLFERLTPGPLPTVNIATSVFNGGTRVTFTFSGAGVDPGNSLQDGLYRLSLFSANILAPGGQPFDGNGDGAPGGDFAFNFHRLFGDGDGNRTVDATDFAGVGAVFGQTLPDNKFDYEANGTIDASDLGQFGNRFGVTL